MQEVFDRFSSLVRSKGDISEHLPTLAKYASQCESVLELGVRGCVSTWAFLVGLLQNNRQKKELLMNDINECDVQRATAVGTSLGVNMRHFWCNDLDLQFENDSIDLVFIDTWHVYGQLRRELAKFSKISKKYIIMHDTTVDEFVGESVRCGNNIKEVAEKSKMSYIDVTVGLWPAIDEFLKENPQWVLHERFFNNNGLTILRRVS